MKVTIITENLSICVSAEDFRPAEYLGDICLDEGNPASELILPGNPVSLDEKEAARILRNPAWGASLCDPSTAPESCLQAVEERDRELARNASTLEPAPVSQSWHGPAEVRDPTVPEPGPLAAFRGR